MNVGQIVMDKKNFVFIGEAGSGKSEIAINFAKALLERGDRPVHFFDLDMTKPLFRSRDLKDRLSGMGILLHYEEQFMDAPTTIGGVTQLLRNEDCYVVMDVGGDYIGARSIGGYAPLLNASNTLVYYVMNSYRPWSIDLEHIDCVLGETLGVSHIQLENLHLIGNPNLGVHTTAQDVLSGSKQLHEMVNAHKEIDFFCVREELYGQVQEQLQWPVLPIQLYLTYPWHSAAADAAI